MPNQTISDAARAMGRAKSARKAAASRENGKLGGRPRRTEENKPTAPVPVIQPCQHGAVLLLTIPKETK